MTALTELLTNPLKETLLQWLEVSTQFMDSRTQDFKFIFKLGKRMKTLSELDIQEMPDEIRGILVEIETEKHRLYHDIGLAKEKEFRKYLFDVYRRAEQAENILRNHLQTALELNERLETLATPFTLPIHFAGRELQASVTVEIDGFSAIIKDGDDAIITQGDTLDELQSMFQEALELHYSDTAA